MSPYGLCQLAVFVALCLVNLSVLTLVHVDQQRALFVLCRIVISALAFIACSHFIVRFGSKWAIQKLRLARPTLLLLLSTSVVATLVHYIFYHLVVIPMLPVNWGELSMQIENKPVDFQDSKAVLMPIVTTLIQYWIWSGCYLAVIVRREKNMLKSQLKEQQLASLQHQINPHFLFNSLNTIRGMIYQDPDKAADIVTQLSELFRYNLTHDLRTHVSIAEEWKICEHYLAIEQVRLGGRLTVSFDCSEALEKTIVPSMALLTLLENAVKHGIAHLPEGGEIQIRIASSQDKVSVVVSNPFNSIYRKSGTRIGLNNIRSRLALMFGQQGLLITFEQDCEFKAVLEVPHAN